MKRFLISLFAIVAILQVSAQTDANVIGHVTSNGEHLPFVNIQVKGTSLGTLTDETGHYHLVNLPIGEQTLVFSFVGYKAMEKKVVAVADKTIEINVNLEEDVLGLEEVVITGSRSSEKRSESPVIVQTIGSELLETTQSVSIGESLNFSTGLRLETNCANCGFSQVRLNGMEGPYSQILINSRPIFSGLAGVYGLEMIPSNMIERIEVVRGGGSALYGGNAIAGTINLILLDPFRNSYEVGASTSLLGLGMDDNALDHNLNFNTTIVSKNYRTGLSLYGYKRNREAWDANGDGFSELVTIDNTTLGARYNQHIGDRSKVAIDFFSINEFRRGGNKFESPEHEADIAESLTHKINTAAVTFEQHLRKNDLLSIYASGQSVKRDSYYGAEQSLSDYGFSQDLTTNSGLQYKTAFANTKIVAGAEYRYNKLTDKKLGYMELDSNNNVFHVPNRLIADQLSQTIGVFAQIDQKWRGFTFSVGARYDNYKIVDLQELIEDKTGNVLSPRINIMYDIMRNLKVRGSFSTGYRAPQIFDEDLHIETSGSRKVIYRNDPKLEAERSSSTMLSLEYYKQIKKAYFNILVEGFHTQLNNPFANEIGEMDENGLVVFTRTNSKSGATIQGINTEISLYPTRTLKFSFGGTIQSSRYEEGQDFDEKRFFRTPNHYGFVTADWDFHKAWCLSASGTYTGSMLVPYFGPTLANPENGELRESDDFFDLGLKLKYTLDLRSSDIQFYAGIKNIFNAYQNDQDLGIDKDPAYIYGPAQPRTIYLGIKLGNFL